LKKLPTIEATGVDIAVIAPPFSCLGNKQDYLLKLYTEVIEASNLPIGIYNLGKNNKTFMAPETIAELLKNPKVVLVKDSSGQDEFISVIQDAVKASSGAIFALSGDEFNGLNYLQAGYDGLL
jgi:dihydrodipicolinate synthase/N-acetylneuraminate lyase